MSELLNAYVEKFRGRTSEPEYVAKLKALPKTRHEDLSNAAEESVDAD